MKKIKGTKGGTFIAKEKSKLLRQAKREARNRAMIEKLRRQYARVFHASPVVNYQDNETIRMNGLEIEASVTTNPKVCLPYSLVVRSNEKHFSTLHEFIKSYMEKNVKVKKTRR